MLKGAPTVPRYLKEDAPTLVNQLGTGDLDYNQLNGAGWRYWTQTDWSGGFQTIKFKDDASFKDGQAVDTISKYGEVKLQRGWVSALAITGSYTLQSHSINQHKLLLGVGKATSAKILSITSAHTVATLSAMTNISGVNSMDRFGADTLIGLARLSAASSAVKTFVRFNGATISGFRSTNPVVRAVKAVGIRAYYSEYVNSLSGDQLGYSSDLSTFTSAFNAGKNRRITKIDEVAGKPYFFVVEGNKVELRLWDEQAERSYVIQTWEDLTSFGVTKFLAYMIITGTTAGKRVAFAFNGARLWQIFDDQLKDSTYDFSQPFEFEGNLQTQGATWDGKFWFPGLYGKYASVQYTPFKNFGNQAWGFAVTGSTIRVGHTSGGAFAISGHVESSNFGHDIGGIAKLVNSCDINMAALAANQTIEVLRSSNGGTSFTTVGTAKHSTDGAISGKRFYFPSGFVTRLWEYKVKLVGPGTSSPTLQDITFEYRPVPDVKRRWRLSIDAGDNVMLLNKQQEQRKGKDLVAQLWLEKDTKRTVRFEDVDGWQTTLVSAFNSAHTSALVKTTRNMPPQGRMRIVSGGVVEEMNYLSADGQQVLGITRAVKGSKARTYAAGVSADNFYNVIVSDVVEQVNDLDDQKVESIAALTLLEV